MEVVCFMALYLTFRDVLLERQKMKSGSKMIAWCWEQSAEDPEARVISVSKC